MDGSHDTAAFSAVTTRASAGPADPIYRAPLRNFENGRCHPAPLSRDPRQHPAAVAKAAYAVAEASDMGDTHAVGETGVGAPTLMGLVARLASPRTTRAGTDGLRDSPLEGAVCCELVSEMELAKPVFWDVDGKMDPFPQAVGHLNDWYYAYFSNAHLAPAAHFPVYQSDLFKTSGFLVNYGSKAHDIGGLDRKIVTGRHTGSWRPLD